jgi:hypothetical protein
MATFLPRDPFGLIRWTTQTATEAASVPGRVLDLLRAAETVVADAEKLLRRAERTATDAEKAVANVQRVTQVAETQIAAAAPLLEFVKEFSAHELQAAIALVDELPKLAGHITDDVMPLLATLDHLGPDIHELLAVTKDVRQAILGIPGFDYLRRRGEDKD